jgi:hypothetical protein
VISAREDEERGGTGTGMSLELARKAGDGTLHMHGPEKGS